MLKKPLDLAKYPTHWVVYRHCHFYGRNHIVERRKTRNGALKAQTSLEYYNDPDEFYFEILRSDEAAKKGIK